MAEDHSEWCEIWKDRRITELERECGILRDTIDHILIRMKPLLPVFAAMLEVRNHTDSAERQREGE